MTLPTHIARIVGDVGTGPPLVYVPGIDGSGELLLNTASRLSEHFRLLRLRYVTTGPPPPGGDRYTSLAESITHCLDEAGIERGLVLCESFGGAVAVQLALDFPVRVAGLAIVNSFVRYDRPSRVWISRALLRCTPRFVFGLARAWFAPMLMIGPRRDRAAVVAFRKAPLLGLGDGHIRRMSMLIGVNLLDRLGELRQPVALFAADRDRVVRSVRAAAAMAERIPNVTLETLEDAGHAVLPLADEPWVQRMQELLARCDPPLEAQA